MPVRLAAGAAALLFALAACGGGSSKPKATHTPTPTRTVKEHVISAAGAKAALLTSKDVGSTLATTTYHTPAFPLYCRPSSAPTVLKESHATSLVGAHFAAKDPKADLIEQIYVYKSSADARAALNQVQGDLDCASGHTYNSDGTSDVVAVGASTDYSAKLTADFAYGWTLRTSDSRGMELAVPVGNTLMLLHYTAGTYANMNKLPDALGLATTAFNRLSRA